MNNLNYYNILYMKFNSYLEYTIYVPWVQFMLRKKIDIFQ